MTIVEERPLGWDPYDPEIIKDPYPIYRRLREEAPLYYNAEYDFYAVSRFADCERGLLDRDTFISGRGAVLEIIKSDFKIPPGTLIFEDPPLHTIHRGLLSRVFTPKRMTALEPQVRAFCARALDPLVESGEFDFAADLGAEMPMRVIGMLLGIPDADLQTVRDTADEGMRTEAGKPMDVSADTFFINSGFADYIDWRKDHPSDDLMTDLLNARFVDETGVERSLSRDEVLVVCNILAGAGNETTGRLIAWAGKVLAEHPDQRRQIAENRALIPQAIEEILRFEPPGPSIARYVAKDTEFHGQKVPAGSALLCLAASGNRDDRRFVNGDTFDIHRERFPHLTFGHGFHVCLGNALARVEGRVALDEVLKRFPDWEVDLSNARLSSTSTVRGWERLPAYVPRVRERRVARLAQEAAAAAQKEASTPGEKWELNLKTPMGPQRFTARLVRDGGELTGTIDGPMGAESLTNGTIVGDVLKWDVMVTKPTTLTLAFEAKVSDAEMIGTVTLGPFGSGELLGRRA